MERMPHKAPKNFVFKNLEEIVDYTIERTINNVLKELKKKKGLFGYDKVRVRS